MIKYLPVLFISVLLSMLFPTSAHAQVVLNADGPGDTYSLITSVLAPGHNPIEVPDCSHTDFGDHIDEIFDDELDAFVFRFHIHVTPDNDRCINFDRQRNEIKSYDKSPDNLLGVEGETVIYKWKFKLSEGFQSSPNFTHLHQLKTVGGSFSSKPLFTLTARKGTPDQLELRYAEIDDQNTLTKTDLEPFIGTWLEVTEEISYGYEGAYRISINRVDNDEVLFQYTDDNIINWREGTEFVRPKWGIYRSLNSQEDLRDETVLFADFSVNEMTVSTKDIKIGEPNWIAYHDQDARNLFLKDIPRGVEFIQILSINGNIIIQHKIGAVSEPQADISTLRQGIYIINLIGKEISLSKSFFVAR